MAGFSVPPACGVEASAERVLPGGRFWYESGCEWSAPVAARANDAEAIALGGGCREREAFSSFMRANAEPRPPFCPAIARFSETRIILPSSASIRLCFHPLWKKSCNVERYSHHVLKGSFVILESWRSSSGSSPLRQ